MKKISLKLRIILFVFLVSTIPLGLFLLISIDQSSKAMVDIIAKRLQGESRLVARSIEGFITQRVLELQVISQADVLEQESANRIGRYLKEIRKEDKWITAFYVVSLSGRVIASTDENLHGGSFFDLYPTAKELFNKSKEAEQDDVFISEATEFVDGAGLLMMTPITDDDNIDVIKVLVARVDFVGIVELLNLLDTQILGKNKASVIDANGAVIASAGDVYGAARVSQRVSVNPKVLEHVFSESGFGYLFYTNDLGDELVTGYAALSGFGVNKAISWRVIESLRLEDVTLSVNRVRNTTIFVGLVLSLFSISIAYVFSRNISRSLREASSHAEQIGRGDFSRSLSFSLGGELGMLATAFNTMAARLNNTQEMLREKNDELVLTAENLRDREQNLEVTLNSIGDAVVTTDAHGLITRMNPVAEQLTGWSLHEAKGRPVKAVMPIVNASTREVIANPVEKVLATGEVVFLSNHTTLISKNGNEYQIADSAAPIRNGNDTIQGMVLVFNDVTESYRLRHEKDLALASIRLSEERFLLVAKATNDVIWDWDFVSNTVWWNDSMQNVFGHALDELEPGAESWTNRIHAEDSQRVIAGIHRVIDGGGYHWSDEYRFRRVDGSYAQILDRGYVIRNAKGEPTRMIGAMMDVSERKKNEKELENHRRHLQELVEEKTHELIRANERLQEMDRLKSLFIASISHELRTPLNSIIGFSSIMKRGVYGELNQKYKDYISRVNRSGQHLLSLVTDIIDISKIESGHVEVELSDFFIDELIFNAVEDIRRQAEEKGLSLSTDVPRGILLHTDRTRLLECLLNFLSNALKYSEEGVICVTVEDKDPDLLLTVSDTGVGMSEQDLTRLFEAFERFESHLRVKAGGTGLGLYLTKKIATELLQGEVGARSVLGEGSAFWIRIPKTLAATSETGGVFA